MYSLEPPMSADLPSCVSRSVSRPLRPRGQANTHFDHVAAARMPQRKFRGVRKVTLTSTPSTSEMMMYTKPTRKIGPMALAFSGVIDGTILEKRRFGRKTFRMRTEAPRLAGTGKRPARVSQKPRPAGMTCDESGQPSVTQVRAFLACFPCPSSVCLLPM